MRRKEQRPIDAVGFLALAQRLADAWMELDADRAVACFTEDAVYMEPPDVQLFVGHDQLRAYFAALTEGTTMELHHVWFDMESQTGALEFSFGSTEQPTAVHGVAVAVIRDGAIAEWREYQRRGAAPFREFVATEGKDWEWTIANYP